jgi:hypothetical protein
MQTADGDAVGVSVTPVSNLTEFFRDALAQALSHQHVTLDAHTAHYVVSLLTLYSRTEVSGPGRFLWATRDGQNVHCRTAGRPSYWGW